MRKFRQGNNNQRSYNQGKRQRTGNGFFGGRYGIDELGRTLMILCAVIYLIGILTQSSLLLTIAMMGLFFELYRMMSKQHWDRREENRRYNQQIKLWKLRYKERHTSRIYMCKSCGRMVRVPKKKGKVQVTCPVCGCKSIHRT